MKKCLCGCGRTPVNERLSRGTKEFFNFECYQRFRREMRIGGGTLQTLDMSTAQLEERQELLDWAKIGDRECMKILRNVHGLTTFHDGRALICMENARL